MKLFGLIESFVFTIADTHRVPVPHPDLFGHLEKHAGASAGLELVSGKKSVNIPPVKFFEQQVHLDLYAWFKQRGQKTYFLDSVEQLRKQAGLIEQCIYFKVRAEEELDCENKKRLWKEANKVWIEAEYQRMVGKEELLLENIARFRPDLVFLGAAHAASFYRQRERLQREYGITIDEYWEDRVIRHPSNEEIWNAVRWCTEKVPMEHYLTKVKVEMRKIDDPKDALHDLETTCIERRYRAVKKGRVTDDNPDYIGSWDLDFEEKGLFEVFVKERVQENDGTRIRGVIEDCNGSAGFEGKLEKNSIEFVKRYTNAAPHAAKGNIRYAGWLRPDGRYLGTFCAIGCRGNFWMKPFKEELTLSQRP